MNIDLYECRGCGTVSTRKWRICRVCDKSSDDGNVMRRIRGEELATH